MKQGVLFMFLLVSSFLTACGNEQDRKVQSPAVAGTSFQAEDTEKKAGSSGSESIEKEEEDVKIQITVGDTILTAVPEENPSAEAFLALLQEQPVILKMSDYGRMEKVGSLGSSLPRSDTKISVGAGDVVLYQGNQITIYYDNNTWNFTKLAVIEEATRESLLDVLGTGDVTVTFSIAE